MLKLIPYTKQLISIGNQRHYEGQLVWSDGRVAYGWDYAPQQQPQPKLGTTGGFWIGEQGTVTAGISWYKLANKALQLSNKISGGSKLNLQCYPCYAQVRDTGGYPPEYGAVYTPNGAYTYNGAIVAMDSDGSLITYDDYTLNFYGVPNGQRQDTHQLPLYYAYVRLIVNNQLLFDGWVYLSIGKNNGEINQYYLYNLDNVQIAHYYLQNDVWTLDYNGQQYTGDDILEKHYTKPLLSVECTQILLQQLHSLDYAVFDGIVAVDGLRLTIDPTDARSDLITQHIRGDDVRKLFQLAKTDECYLTALTPDKDANGNSLFTGQYYISYTSTLTGTIFPVPSGGPSAEDVFSAEGVDELTITGTPTSMKANVKKFVLPDATEIVASLFQSDTNVEEVDAPNAVSAGSAAFSGASKLNKVVLPKVETLNNNVFASTVALKKIELPELTTINYSPFASSYAEEIYAPKLNTVSQNNFNGAKKLKKLTVGNNLTISSSVNTQKAFYEMGKDVAKGSSEIDLEVTWSRRSR